MKKPIKISPENIERARTLKAMKWTNVKIAKDMGVDEKTVRRWLQRADDPEIACELDSARLANNERYIEDAYEICFAANELIKAALITVDVTKAADIKAIATTMGIYLDKIVNLSSQGRTKEKASPIQINILPAEGYGNPTRVVADTVQVHEQPSEIHGDSVGSGSGENVLRLPEGCEDGTGVPE